MNRWMTKPVKIKSMRIITWLLELVLVGWATVPSAGSSDEEIGSSVDVMNLRPSSVGSLGWASLTSSSASKNVGNVPEDSIKSSSSLQGTPVGEAMEEVEDRSRLCQLARLLLHASSLHKQYCTPLMVLQDLLLNASQVRVMALPSEWTKTELHSTVQMLLTIHFDKTSIVVLGTFKDVTIQIDQRFHIEITASLRIDGRCRFLVPKGQISSMTAHKASNPFATLHIHWNESPICQHLTHFGNRN